MLAGAALRFSNLGLQSFDYEEVVVARIIHPGFLDTLAGALQERTPPTYYLLAWVWSQVFGTTESGLRSLSAVIGTLTILAAYASGKALVGKRAGVVAASLVAVNPALVWYSQYARAYILLVAFATLGLYFFARALREPSRRVLGWWAAVSVLALASHYFAAFLVLPEGAYLLWTARSRRVAAPAIAVVGAFGLALVPLVLFQATTHALAEDYANRSIGGRVWRTFESFAAGPPARLHQGTLVSDVELIGIVCAVLSVVCAVILLLGRANTGERRRTFVVAGIGMTALLVPVVLAIGGFDYVIPRYYLAVVVTLILFTAAGLGLRRSGPLGVIVATLVSVVLAGVAVANTVSPSTQLPPSRDIAAAVGPAHARRVLVVPKAFDKTLVYYLRAGEPRVLRHGGHDAKSEPAAPQALRVTEIVLVDDSLDLARSLDGFRRTRRRRVDQLDVYVFSSPQSRTVTIGALDGWRGGRGSVLVDGPHADRRPVATGR